MNLHLVGASLVTFWCPDENSLETHSNNIYNCFRHNQVNVSSFKNNILGSHSNNRLHVKHEVVGSNPTRGFAPCSSVDRARNSNEPSSNFYNLVGQHRMPRHDSSSCKDRNLNHTPCTIAASHAGQLFRGYQQIYTIHFEWSDGGSTPSPRNMSGDRLTVGH